MVVHPVMGVERDQDGTVTRSGRPAGALHRESVMHFEVDRAAAGRAAGAGRGGSGAGAGGRAAVRARLPCRWSTGSSGWSSSPRVAGSRYAKDEMSEAVAFLHWLKADNYVFLGYREYAVDRHRR